MKVQCDVCSKAPATLMCCADEAALCAHCDFRIHAANKLANKHQRIPLQYPSVPDDLPSCDICQDKTAFFFCVEDRALLCRECDYSIHSSKNLASKHRRFLITGIRVALHCIASNDASNSTQSGSISQLSSQSNQNIQPSVPSKFMRALHASNNITGSSIPTPDKPPPPLHSKDKFIVLDEETSFSSIRQLSSNTRSSKHVTSTSVNKEQSISSNVKRSNTSIHQSSSTISSSTFLQSSSKISNKPLPSSSKISSSSINKDDHSTHFDVEPSIGIISPPQRIQFPTRSQTSSQHLSSSKELYGKSATTNQMVNPQVPLNPRRQVVDCSIRQQVVDASPHQLNIGPAIACQIGGSNYTRRGSISEYLTETIPGWKVDELLSLSDMEAMYNFNDNGSSRVGASSYGDMDWPTDNINTIFDDSIPCGAATAEVPTMPSPPTFSGIPRSVKPFGHGKSLRQHDLDFMLGGDDALVVPDIGGISSPLTSSPTSPPLKRRRTFMDF